MSWTEKSIFVAGTFLLSFAFGAAGFSWLNQGGTIWTEITLAGITGCFGF